MILPLFLDLFYSDIPLWTNLDISMIVFLVCWNHCLILVLHNFGNNPSFKIFSHYNHSKTYLLDEFSSFISADIERAYLFISLPRIRGVFWIKYDQNLIFKTLLSVRRTWLVIRLNIRFSNNSNNANQMDSWSYFAI